MAMLGNTVIIHRLTIDYDEDYDRVGKTEDETVDNVLIAPGNTSDIDGQPHFSGVNVDFTLGFPKTYSYKSLRGCTITLPAPWNVTGRVIGDPVPNDPKNCPTQWYLTVYLEVSDG